MMLRICKLILVLAVTAGLLLTARKLDERMNRRAIEADTFKGVSTHASYVRGTLILDEDSYDYFHSFENYLLIGTDETGNETGEGDEFQNSMGDYLLLLSIDKSASTYSFLELDRDTMTEVRLMQKDGSYKDTAELALCIAHWYGGTKELGCENQVIAVQNLLGGLPINGYYSFSIRDLPELNKAIGGVRVTLEDDFSREDPAMKKGVTLTLSDEQAYRYLRDRMSVGEGTNEERMGRQHAYLAGFLEQSRQKLSADAGYFYRLFETLESIAVTNLTGKQLSRIARALTSFENKGIYSFEGDHIIEEAWYDGEEHTNFYIYPESLIYVMSEMYQLQPRLEYESEEEYPYWIFETEMDTDEFADTEGFSTEYEEEASLTVS